MEHPSKIADPDKCPERLSSLRGGNVYLVSKARIRDYLFPTVCSLSLHAVMFILISLSVFRTPAVIVSSDPVNIWLIPFIAAGDIRSEAALAIQSGSHEPNKPERYEPERSAELPSVAGSPASELRADESPPDVEEADAELLVLPPQKKERPAKSSQNESKAAAVEAGKLVARTDLPVVKSAAIDQPVVPTPVKMPLPTARPARAAEPQTTVDRPRPVVKQVVEPKPAPAEIVPPRETVAQQTRPVAESVPREPVVTEPAGEPIPVSQPVAAAQPPLVKQVAEPKPVPRETVRPRKTAVQPVQPVAESVRKEAVAPAPAAEPARAVQPAAAKQSPVLKPAAAPKPLAREIARPRETATQQTLPVAKSVRKEAPAAAHAVEAAPAPSSRLKTEAIAATARPEPRNQQSLNTGGEKNTKREPSPTVVPAAKPPPATIVVKPAIVDKPTPVLKKQETPQGIIAPKVTGDIKLSVSGQVIPAISITFQEFAPSRRNRPFSRAEARREPGVVLPLVSSRDDVHTFVVVQARAGIYTFTARAKDAPLNATFQLLLFEGGAREKTRKLGAINVADRAVVVKLLMPDGIAWDDDAAFTGTMEDSDSITKFNADTGLVWKEYR